MEINICDGRPFYFVNMLVCNELAVCVLLQWHLKTVWVKSIITPFNNHGQETLTSSLNIISLLFFCLPNRQLIRSACPRRAVGHRVLSLSHSALSFSINISRAQG